MVFAYRKRYLLPTEGESPVDETRLGHRSRRAAGVDGHRTDRSGVCGRPAARCPEGRDRGRPDGLGDGQLPETRQRGRGRRPQVHPERRPRLLARCDLAGGQEGAQRGVDRRLPRPRQRLAKQVPQRAHAGDPERLRAESPRRRRRHPPVLRRGSDWQGDQARQGRGRRPEPPLLRERQLRARAARGDARDGPAAGRQLRRRLHQGRCGGGHRRGPHGARVLRSLDPGRQEHDRPDLAGLAHLPRPPAPVRQPPQPGLHRPDGPDSAELGLLPIDRPAGRPGGGQYPRRGDCAARSGETFRRSSRPSRASGWSSTRPTSRRRRTPARRRTSRSRSGRAIRPFSPPGSWSRSAGTR